VSRLAAPALALALATLAGCMASGAGTAGPPAAAESTTPGGAGDDPANRLVPAGYGTLRQDDITLGLRADDVQVRVTPLAEWVIRLTAPDTYRRLHATVEQLGPERTTGRLPFLVSFFTDVGGGALVEPRELTLLNRGRRFRPELIQGLTSGWGSGRLDQGRPAQAVYLFDGAVDLESDLEVEFGGARTADWTRILPRLETELARARARAGQPSRPNFLILR
jgi:hypothetical protein